MKDTPLLLPALENFAESVSAKLSQLTAGEPEEQLRAPFENFMKDVAEALGWNVVCTGETPLPDRLGKPDFAVHRNGLLAGYVELKAPGVGVTASRFKDRNRKQFKRFSGIPNLLYSDGNEWALYRDGKLVGKVARLSGDIVADGGTAVASQDALTLERLLRDYLLWEPFIPIGRNGKIDLKGFAAILAPLCRMLREDVAEALKNLESPLIQLAKDWRQLLFPDATDEQFADAYAQTVTFALLLGRSEGADPLTLTSAENSLAAQHTMLASALQVLTDRRARTAISASLDLVLRVVACVPLITLFGPEDLWLYFYEDFLAEYDSELRKDVGVYYTPVEVVHAQVRLIDDLLVNRLGKPLGFADSGVVTLDPAAGTGTYIVAVIEHALGRIASDQGPGAVAGQATALAHNLFGFELLVGPYAVTELRVSRALQDRGAQLPADGTHIYLTDTLESPHAVPPQPPLFLQPIADQHAKALKVKSQVPVIVCLGNPPYDRHAALPAEHSGGMSRFGGWVRFGDPESDIRPETGKPAKGVSKKKKKMPRRVDPRAQLRKREQLSILYKSFVEPALTGGHGVHLKWLYNLYVYFWRWALWKVFEHETARGPGVVSFITASSYLFGDAFVGMREHMRRQCDEIWILDLGGEGRGARKEENVFAIQTPVAIAIAVRSKKANTGKPAKVHYTRVEGTRGEKLRALDSITEFTKVKWQNCPDDWQAPFLPFGKGCYFNWPIIRDLFPWQHSGSQLFRTWPIVPDESTLVTRWKHLLKAPDRAKTFKESRDRRIDRSYQPLLLGQPVEKPLAELKSSALPPTIVRYSYRAFDRQYTFADSRIGDVMKPVLWNTVSSSDSKQIFLGSQLWQVLGVGPALVASSFIPDFHFFKGSYGGKDIIPLYRAADASEANLLPGLLELLSSTYRRQKNVTPEDFLAYVYGVLAQPDFTARYAKELETRELRVPITKDAALFEKLRDLGARLLWLHTYGERFVPTGKTQGQVPLGAAKCVKSVPETHEDYPDRFEYIDGTSTVRVGAGEFAPVARAVFDFAVSGLKVVQSWLKYRMKNGGGKKSSPLDNIRPERWTDQFTTELLELLWVLEATVEGYPEQAKLLEAVVAGECFPAIELPKVPDAMRKPPKVMRETVNGLFDDLDDG